MMSVIRGYQNKGVHRSDAAMLDQLKRKASIIAEQNKPDMAESIYSGVHSNPGVNLYRIQ